MLIVYKAFIFKISVFALQSARKICIVMATNEKKDTAVFSGILIVFIFSCTCPFQAEYGTGALVPLSF